MEYQWDNPLTVQDKVEAQWNVNMHTIDWCAVDGSDKVEAQWNVNMLALNAQGASTPDKVEAQWNVNAC